MNSPQSIEARACLPAAQSNERPTVLLTAFESRFLLDATGGKDVLLLMGTRSRADIGLWFRRARIWVACSEDCLVAFAYGPKPYLKKFLMPELKGSIYNHITGHLVLAPEDGLPFCCLEIDQAEAYQLLSKIHNQGV